MSAYWTVLLVVLTTDIAGGEWQCNDTCCAGAYKIDGNKCGELQSCNESDGQYIIRAGNKTQDNKCWCNECKGFAPERPKQCEEKNEFCLCIQCLEGTYPHIKDKDGQYVEHFDKEKHCKPLPHPNCTHACEPTGNKIGDGIGIGIGISFGVFFLVLFTTWICYSWRHKKCTCVFVTKERHESALREKDNELTAALERHESALRDKDSALLAAQRNACEDVITMGGFVLDKTLIKEFETGTILSKEDTKKWIKDTFWNIPVNLRRCLPVARTQEEDLMLRDLAATMEKDDWFPLGKSMRIITKPDMKNIIRQTAIDELTKVLKNKAGKPKRVTLFNCMVNAGYGQLVNKLRETEGRARTSISESSG